jgi:hypothetical protein
MRKEQIVTLQDAGENKTFKVKQLPATKAERFLVKFVLLIGGNAEIKDLQDNPAGFLSALADKPYEKVQELFDVLLSCVSRVQDGGIEVQLTPENVDGFIEEMQTLLKLRVEAFKINNFFPQNASESLTGFGGVTIKRQSKG